MTGQSENFCGGSFDDAFAANTDACDVRLVPLDVESDAGEVFAKLGKGGGAGGLSGAMDLAITVH